MWNFEQPIIYYVNISLNGEKLFQLLFHLQLCVSLSILVRLLFFLLLGRRDKLLFSCNNLSFTWLFLYLLFLILNNLYFLYSSLQIIINLLYLAYLLGCCFDFKNNLSSFIYLWISHNKWLLLFLLFNGVMWRYYMVLI